MRVPRLLTAALALSLAALLTAACSDDSGTEPAGTTTVTGTHRASVGMRFPSGTTGQFDFGVGYRQRPNARYFGLGPETVESAKSYYRQNLAWLGTSYSQRVFGNVYLGGDVLLSSVDAKDPGDDDVRPITDVFINELPLGYGSTSKGISIGSLYHT